MECSTFRATECIEEGERSGNKNDNFEAVQSDLKHNSTLEKKEGKANFELVRLQVHRQVSEDEWPNKGVLQLVNLCARYRKGLPLVLRNITLNIRAGERVGLVGRTGSGKSSLGLALYRMIETWNGDCEFSSKNPNQAGSANRHGPVLLDGVDIAMLGLSTLRSRLAIIPQDPVLFSGTLRSNLDPFDDFQDAEIWKALGCVHMKEFVRTRGKEYDEMCSNGETVDTFINGGQGDRDGRRGLNFTVHDGGSNLSAGQRQLFCLSRALLRKPRVLILDEATACVDVHTDTRIQETIRANFANTTMLVIAHRLETVLGLDRVIVMDAGRVVEFDRPASLLRNAESKLSSLVRELNSNGQRALRDLANQQE